MAEITAQMVKDLREKSGAGMMDCKKALTESEGDFNKAMNLLRERGAAIASKRAARAAKEGLIAVQLSPDNRKGSMVELNSESDFVARNEDFQKLVRQIAEHLVTLDSADELQQSQISGQSVADLVQANIGKIGENLVLSRFALIKSTDGLVFSYVHPPGKIGILVEVTTSKPELAQDKGFVDFARSVAMHIAAMQPICISRDEVPAELLANEREIYKKQALNEGKPEKIVDKIVDGRVQKYYTEVCLLDQPFAMNQDQKVEDFVKQNATKYGSEVKIAKFLRYRVGETAATEQAAE